MLSAWATNAERVRPRMLVASAKAVPKEGFSVGWTR